MHRYSAGMQRIVIAFVGVKGGLGKSTLAFSLAVAYRQRGYRVLLIDLDDQQRALLKWSESAAELGVTDSPPVVAMGDNLRAQFDEITQGYDVVIIDTAGKLGKRTAHALGKATIGLMPCGPDGIQIASMPETFEAVLDVQAVRPDLLANIVLCQRDLREVASRELRKTFDEAPFECLDVELDYASDYDKSFRAGVGPTSWNSKSKAARDVNLLADELERRLGMTRKKERIARGL